MKLEQVKGRLSPNSKPRGGLRVTDSTFQVRIKLLNVSVNVLISKRVWSFSLSLSLSLLISFQRSRFPCFFAQWKKKEESDEACHMSGSLSHLFFCLCLSLNVSLHVYLPVCLSVYISLSVGHSLCLACFCLSLKICQYSMSVLSVYLSIFFVCRACLSIYMSLPPSHTHTHTQNHNIIYDIFLIL